MTELSNMEMEQHVLGCMFIDAEAVSYCINTLKYIDFASTRHQEIFLAMCRLNKKHINVDQLTVQEELKRVNKLQTSDDFVYIVQLSKHMPTIAQLHSYVEVLLEYSRRRALQDVSLTLKCDSTSLDKNQDTVINETIESLQEIAAHNTASVKDICDLVEEYLAELKFNRENPAAVSGITTGFVALDKLLRGLKPGSLNLLAARPSMGKTALALNIALNAARNEGREKKKVLFISLEMTEKELINRCASSLAGLDCSKIQDPQLLSEGETSAAAYAVYKLMNLGVVIHRESEFTLQKLHQLVQKLKRTEKPDFIVIDYLQLMVTDHRDDSYTKVTKISNGLKALALELDIPILALSQLNRAVEGRAVKKPLLSDLRESGSLEQDADVVMLLSRKDYYEKSDCKEPGVAELELAKARNGALGRVKLFFDRSSCNFMELG